MEVKAMKYYEKIGDRFGRLTLLEPTDYYTKSGAKYRGYLCQCDCGAKKVLSRKYLVSGDVKSCGCLNLEINKDKVEMYRELIKLGDVETVRALNNTYKGMKTRCYNSNNPNYKHYGARGIRICDEWLEDKLMFVAWALENGFDYEKSIDRINVNGNYEPSNCRWATSVEQNNNTRRNRYINYNGTKYTIAQLSRLIGIDSKILSKLSKSGIDLCRSEQHEK
jgi:hypothetical protein